MRYEPVPLVWYFSLVPKSANDSDDQDFRPFFGEPKRTGWPELEEEFRCVILAEAGAGKSFEMEVRASHGGQVVQRALTLKKEKYLLIGGRSGWPFDLAPAFFQLLTDSIDRPVSYPAD